MYSPKVCARIQNTTNRRERSTSSVTPDHETLPSWEHSFTFLSIWSKWSTPRGAEGGAETLLVLLRFQSFPRPSRVSYTPSAIFRHTQGEWSRNYGTVPLDKRTRGMLVTPQRETRTLSHPQSNSITIRCNRIFPSRRVLTKYHPSIIERDIWHFARNFYTKTSNESFNN